MYFMFTLYIAPSSDHLVFQITNTLVLQNFEALVHINFLEEDNKPGKKSKL